MRPSRPWTSGTRARSWGCLHICSQVHTWWACSWDHQPTFSSQLSSILDSTRVSQPPTWILKLLTEALWSMSGCQIPVSMGNKDWRQGLLFCHLANISISFQSITVALRISFYDVMFSRQQYWSGLPYPFPGDLADPGIKPRSPAWQVHSTTEPSF